MSKVFSLIYGVMAYGVFLAVFVYAIGFIGGLGTPTSLDGALQGSRLEAIAINIGLLAAFAVQHSGMARPAFKRWWTRLVPVAIERSTYVLISSLAMILLFLAWRPIGGVIWEAQGMVRTIVTIVYACGWAVLLYATFLIDHFDLFGLKQVWRAFTGRTYRDPEFHTPGMYKIVRHPLYVGWLMIFWAAPTMTAAHLIFALMTTAYILVAIQFEERDLMKAHPEYAEYRRRTPMLIPRLGRKPARTKTGAIA